MIQVPDTVRNKAKAVGAEWWLHQLPAIVAELEAAWNIEVGQPYTDSTEAFVARQRVGRTRRSCSSSWCPAAAMPHATR